MNKKVYLTFDLDWAIDEVIDDVIDLMDTLDVCGVLHVTHNTPRLDIIRKTGRMELGIHPNFNPILLNQPNENGLSNIDDVFHYVKEIVPEAVCCRSHALTAGSLLFSKYSDYGIVYDLNHYMPPKEGVRIKPWRVEGLQVTFLPFIFEDDAWMVADADKRPGVDYYLSDRFDAPRIFNFHPIHLFLNTDHMETYIKAKEGYKDYEWISGCKNSSQYGTRDFFVELVTKARNEGWVFEKISDTDWR